MNDPLITRTEFDAWPKCAVPACQNKSCRSLASKYCWPHTPGSPIEAAANLRDTENISRTAMAVAALNDGKLTAKEIAASVGLTHQSIYRIAKDIGTMSLKNLKASRDAERQQRAKSHVIRLERKRYLLAMGATTAFRVQKNNAKTRGIAWHLSIEEWWAAWDASGKWSERGRGNGKYVMSRHGDVGPYEIGNISIVVNVVNVVEARNHNRRPRAEGEGRGVHHIYPGSPRPWVAMKGRIRLGAFPTFEEAQIARLAAMQLKPT